MRLRYVMPLLLVSFAAWAFSPEELLSERQVSIKCENGVCTVPQQDMEWIVGRDRLLSQLVDRLYDKAQSCNGGRST